MQYHLTHRGTVVATFDTSCMDPMEAAELRSLKGKFFEVVPDRQDRLPEIPGYSQLADIERSGGGWKYNPDDRPPVQAPPRQRKHSTRATSWL